MGLALIHWAIAGKPTAGTDLFTFLKKMLFQAKTTIDY
jgi:hypothetical protein